MYAKCYFSDENQRFDVKVTAIRSHRMYLSVIILHNIKDSNVTRTLQIQIECMSCVRHNTNTTGLPYSIFLNYFRHKWLYPVSVSVFHIAILPLMYNLDYAYYKS
jgi:hypothetical protein